MKKAKFVLQFSKNEDKFNKLIQKIYFIVHVKSGIILQDFSWKITVFKYFKFYFLIKFLKLNVK